MYYVIIVTEVWIFLSRLSKIRAFNLMYFSMPNIRWKIALKYHWMCLAFTFSWIFDFFPILHKHTHRHLPKLVLFRFVGQPILAIIISMVARARGQSTTTTTTTTNTNTNTQTHIRLIRYPLVNFYCKCPIAQGEMWKLFWFS